MICSVASHATTAAPLRAVRLPPPALPPRPLPSAPQTGDYVDIVANSSIQKGMPYKFYHGRTGIVYNVSRRAVGVEVNKQVRNRIETKRVNVRIEHVKPSTCRIDFLNRVKRNDEKKRDAKAKGIRLPITDIKRFPVQPKAGYVVKAESDHGLPQVIAPQAFDDMCVENRLLPLLLLLLLLPSLLSNGRVRPPPRVH